MWTREGQGITQPQGACWEPAPHRSTPQGAREAASLAFAQEPLVLPTRLAVLTTASPQALPPRPGCSHYGSAASLPLLGERRPDEPHHALTHLDAGFNHQLCVHPDAGQNIACAKLLERVTNRGSTPDEAALAFTYWRMLKAMSSDGTWFTFDESVALRLEA